MKNKMIFRLDKSLKVNDITISKNNTAMVMCKIPRFNVIRDYLQVGESMTTKDHFDINFNGLATKWKMIFYLNGQYDNGVASDDCRLYLMLISCEKATVKMNIKTSLIFSPRSFSDIVSSRPTDSLFITNDKKRNWAGPFILRIFENDVKRSEDLTIKCVFRLIVDNINEFKRSLSDAYSSSTDNLLLTSSKKFRFIPPPAKEKHHNVAEQDCSPMDVDVHLESSPNPLPSNAQSSMEVDPLLESSLSPLNVHLESTMETDFTTPPDPFTTKSPLYRRLMQPRQYGENTAKNFVNSQRGDFYRRSSLRTIIFSPKEREEARNVSCSRMPLNRSANNLSKPNVLSKPFQSSGLLQVFDIASVAEADPGKETAKSDIEENPEATTSGANMLPGDGDSNEEMTFRDKISMFEKSFQ